MRGGECDPQPRERMVMDKQRSTLNGHTTDEGGNGLYKGWNPGRIYQLQGISEGVISEIHTICGIWS